jgi:hypothetical protein
MHGFLVVRSEAGKAIGSGELIQFLRGDTVHFRLTFRFRDGSIDDESALFSQHQHYRLLSDHHIQRGASFPKPLDLTIAADGQVTSRIAVPNGPPKVEVLRVAEPATLINGMLCSILANLDPAQGDGLKLAMIAPAQKPRLIHLAVSHEPDQHFQIAGLHKTATVFRLKTQLGGMDGVIAPIIGKQPPDLMVWVLEGPAPTLIRATGQLAEDGPTVSFTVAGVSVAH